MLEGFTDERLYKNFVVYKIHNAINKKNYIGVTENFKRRFAVHWYDVRRGRQTVLCRNIRKYGKQNFIVSKIDYAFDWKEACRKEQKYINEMNTKAPFGMNMTDGGDGTFGIKMSKETREKMRQSHLGKNIGEDNPMYGKPGAMLGKKWSKESRKKLSDSCKGRIPWNKGTKGLQKAWNKGKKYSLSPESLAKFRKSRASYVVGDETRKKFSQAHKGKFLGEKSSQSKITEKDVLNIRKFYANKEMNQYQLAEKYGLTQSNISCIIKRKSWAHI